MVPDVGIIAVLRLRSIVLTDDSIFMFQLKIEHPWYGCARLVNKSNDQNHIYSKHLNTKLEKT